MNKIEDKLFYAKERIDLDKFEFEGFFGNNHPVEIEIGCGKGRFAVERGAENPGVNIMALDQFWKFMKNGYAKMERLKLENVAFLKSEAFDFISQAVPDESISMFHMYFPDPWPKRRHNRRRLFNESFLRVLAQKAKSEGVFQIATDDEEYYGVMKEAISKVEDIWALARETENERICMPGVKTNYEVKWEAEGKTLHYMELLKR